MKRIIIGADHAGYTLKEYLKNYLKGKGWEINDVGTESADPVDYPDFGCEVALKVARGDFPRGILICGSGVGMTVLANKFPGIRAVLCLDVETAKLSRLHNDANILCLAGRRTGKEDALKILDIWLNTAFEGGRHQRRLDKIRKWEEKICPHPIV